MAETAKKMIKESVKMLEADATEIARLREALVRISRMKTVPDDVMNLVTLSAAIQIANDAINPEPRT